MLALADGEHRYPVTASTVNVGVTQTVAATAADADGTVASVVLGERDLGTTRPSYTAT